MRLNPRPRAWDRSPAVLFLAGCLILLVLSGTAVAATSSLPRQLRVAAELRTQADRALVFRAKALNSCLRAHHQRGRCRAARASVQRAGIKLAKADRHFSRLTRQRAHASGSGVALVAPQLTVSGDGLTWPRVAHVQSYLLARFAPGQAVQYSLISGLKTTPPPLPGATVAYSLRTAREGSAWSQQRSITYPAPPTVDTQAAPTISVSGQTLSWNPIATVNTYVLVRKVPGATDQYSVLSGTSTTPAPTPGATVRYSVRTAVAGSAWAPEVPISYPVLLPAPPPPPPPPPPAEEASSPAAGFQPGLNSGWIYSGNPDLTAAVQLGAKLVRVEFPIEYTPAQMERTIAGYAAQGIRVAPLATFTGRMPTPTEAQSLAGWAKAYGPGGTFWAGRSDGQLAIRTIEFGNETSGGYQYGDGAGMPSYTLRAQTYAVRLKEAAVAISGAGVKVGLMAVADDWTGDWMNGMFSAVPNLGSYVAGWVSHPYGPEWKKRFEDITKHAAAHGAPSSIPIDITEWGFATDNGRCLTENYGWNPCMSYLEAAEKFRQTITEMRASLGSRIGLFILYQIRDQAVSGTTTSREAYFGFLQHELGSKGVFTTAAQEMLSS
jgi:hypothetical protein